jgi:hypothetical protein
MIGDVNIVVKEAGIDVDFSGPGGDDRGDLSA